MKWWILLGILCIIIFLTMYFYKRWWKPAVEGFQVATYGPSADWNNYKISTDGKSYTIFDTEALYVQAQMYKYTLQAAYNRCMVLEKHYLQRQVEYMLESKRRYLWLTSALVWEIWSGEVKLPISNKLAIFSLHLYYNIDNTNCSDECWWMGGGGGPSPGGSDGVTGRFITHYYKKLEDRGIAVKQSGRYHNDCFTWHSGRECPPDELLSYYIVGTDYSKIVIAYINNLVANFEREILHNNFEMNPVGKFLAKIQSQLHRPCYLPLDLLPGPQSFTYPSVDKKIHSQGTEMPELPYGSALEDDKGNLFYPNALSLTADGTEKNANPADAQKNVLLNPSEWRLVDLAPASAELSGRDISNKIRDEFLDKKGILKGIALSGTQLTGAGQENILMKTIAINGTMSQINMDEIRRSVFYTLHFNFTDMNNTTKQLLYTQTSPFRLMFSKYHNFENLAFITNDFNDRQAVELTQDIINVLTYDAMSYISSWGKARRVGVMNGLINQFKSMHPEVTNYILNSVQPEITNDMIKNTYSPMPKIYIYSADVINDKSYVQTTEEIQFTKTRGPSAIIGNPELRMTTNTLEYLTNHNNYNIVGISVEVYAMDEQGDKHSFTGATIKSFTTLTPNTGILTLDCSNVVELSIRDSLPYAFTDNGMPFPFTYTIHFTAPKIINSNTLYVTDTQRFNILDAIAQCFYDVNSLNNDPNKGIRISTIVDLYQIGDTIFDARLRISERDPVQTAQLLEELSTLKSNYTSYIDKPMTEAERIQLDLNYNTQYQKLLTNLQYAVSGSSNDSCGIYAQYIRIYAIDHGHIALSQVEVIDNTNQNIAIGARVTWGPYQASDRGGAVSAKIYTYEEPNPEMYGDGSNDPQIAQMNATGLGVQRTIIQGKHLNSIVDGTRIPRIEPNIYENNPDSDGSGNNFIEIDFGYEVNITYVNLIFPKGMNSFPSYTIILKDSSYNDITNASGVTGAVTNNSASVVFSNTGINNYMTTKIASITDKTITFVQDVPTWLTAGMSITIQTADMSINVYTGLVNTISGRQLTLATAPNSMNTSTLYAISPGTSMCPKPINGLYNPYWLARFYADIKTTSAAGYIQVDKYYIKFTGYSGGEVGSPEADAVFTFNPMYNGGFVKPLTSGAGNMNYQPTIKFTNTNDPPDINCQRDAKRIMHDYMMNITNSDFQKQNGTYYENGYNYFVSSITAYGEGVAPAVLSNAKACKFRWNEQKVEAVTNKLVETIDRTGTFIYIKGVYDWKVSTDYFDPVNSVITTSDTAGLTPFSPPMEILIPTITEVNLDTLNDICPTKTCSDLDVIDSLIKTYNNQNSDTILRVVKAVTPTPTQCEFECYTKSSGESRKRIRINLDIVIDPATYICNYNYRDGGIVTEADNGTYIQSNTPMLTQVYNYTSEMMGVFKKSVNDIYTNLSTMVQPHISQSGDGMASAVIKYRQDTWGAFGEIKGLSTCSLQCGDPQVIYNFLSQYRNFNTRVAAIKGVGTFNSSTCDYMIDETTMSISGAGAFVEGSPRTAIYRATMNGCGVSAIQNITDQNTASSILLVTRSSVDHIDLSAVIRSNHISFGDTLSFAITTAAPTWMQGKAATFLGTPVFIESASSYLEANIQSISATSIIFYNFFNPRGDFNKYVSTTGPTITGDVPSWLKNGVKVQIFSDPEGTFIYDGTIAIGANNTITQPTLTATTNYNIFSYDTYTISNATPTQPSTAGSWTTPITLGTGLYGSPTTLQVEAGSTSYNGGQPFRLVNKFFNTPATFSQRVVNVTMAPPAWLTAGTAIIISTKTGGIEIYDGSIFSVNGNQITLSTFPSIEALLSNPSDSYNIFLKNDTAVVTGTIQGYSGTSLALNVTNGGPLLAGTSYTIQQTARPKSYPSIPRAFSPIDWIDCSSDFAKRSTGQTNLTQTSIDTCNNTYRFTRPAGSDTLKFNNITPATLPAMTCTTRTSTLTTIGYPIAENESLVSGSTYEYRVTTLNTLPFDQTYKRVTFYGNCQISAIQGADISTSPNKNGAPPDPINYANFFRHWWNVTYYYASKTQNKKVIGVIDGYNYDTNTDSITFRCKSAEFGQNGPADIVKYNESTSSFPQYAYYQVVFRRKYGQTGSLAINSSFTSVDSISNNYMVYSAVATAPSSINAITSPAVDTTTYAGMTNIDTSNYIAQEPSIVLSYQFRFLRFQVTASNATDYAEIARIYFYKKLPDGSYDNSFKLNTLNTTFAAVSGQNITLVQPVPIWLVPNINIKISSDTYSIKQVSGQQITLDKSVTYNISNTYTISYYNNNGSGIFLQSARFRMSDISSNYYNYQNTDCSGGYLKIPNPYKTSYNICAVATRSSGTFDPKYEYTKTGTCSIGYVDYNDSYQKTYTGTGDAPYKTNLTTCITTGTYGEVNSILVNSNTSTKRLRVKTNQYLWIDLGDLLMIDAYTFITGSASHLPTAFELQGSYNGTTWKVLNTKTGFTYPTKSTFYVPGYFPTDGGATQLLTDAMGGQPSFYTSQVANTAFEGFQNPVAESPLLEPFVDKTPYFKPDETALGPRYALPLVNTTPANILYQPLNTQARRIKTMKFRVLETHDPDAKFVHMSMFQFHTSAGPMKSSMVRISNPMGSRRSPSDSPERLLESTTRGRWVDYNKMPLIFTFIEYPQAQIIGFQFAFPDTSNQMAALPSRWKMEGSYDGRNWETYHEKTEKAHYIGNASPIYKFKTEI